MLLEEDILRAKYSIDSDRDIHGFDIHDFIWPPLAIIMKMYYKPLKAILVAYMFWPDVIN